ncbi:MAG: type II toxin-antitoxin system VapC family toxin [Rickettsiales bacterium]
MILVDTSVWVDHLHKNDAKLNALLTEGQVLIHPLVIGELALGSLRKRDTILQLLNDLPRAITVSESEMLDFITKHALFGQGIGYVDAHLLAAARLNGVMLWTRDKRLREAAIKLGLANER